MKRITELVRRYETENPPDERRLYHQRSVRLYDFVKPLRDGECVIETYAAFNARRKGRPLVTKLVFSINSRTGRYRQRDILHYSSWANPGNDHWCVDATEYGLSHTDYFLRSGRKDEKGRWHSDRCSPSEARGAVFPTGRMLNGFGGTKYQYCAYRPSFGVSPYEYLCLFNLDSRVELLAKAGMERFANEEFISYFRDDEAFAKWFMKNWRRVSEKCRTNRGVFRMYGAKMRSETLERLNAERERNARAERRRAERKRIEERTRAAARYDAQISALYERIKGICTKYKAYDVVVPKCGRDMVTEGERMHNCIGAIHPKLHGKDEICVFLHRDGKPFVDIAIDIRTFKVTECRLVNNAEANKGFWSDARVIARRIREIYRKAA